MVKCMNCCEEFESPASPAADGGPGLLPEAFCDDCHLDLDALDLEERLERLFELADAAGRVS